MSRDQMIRLVEQWYDSNGGWPQSMRSRFKFKIHRMNPGLKSIGNILQINSKRRKKNHFLKL